ncbi:hypothetical protein LguiB_019242 [Lonicera macranthoides]
MDPQTPPPTATSLPPLPNAKLRLMCSYGGHIAPRPHDKSLCYLGGDTRIVALDRRTTASSLTSLSAHLSRTLYNNRPFTLKYQLPNEDLDCLISITTDEDLYNMIEEQDRIVSSRVPSRIRLFLFPSSKPEFPGSVLLDPTWFCDALKSARIMQRDDSGFDYGEGQFEVNNNNNKQESMVLETSSSFGSTGSSVSMSNLPPIGVNCEDGGLSLQDKKVKVASPGSVESNNGVNDSHQKTGMNQDKAVQLPSFETKLTSNTDESESIIFDPSSMIQMQKPIQVSSYQLPHLPAQTPHQQEVQYIQAGPHYLPQYPTSKMPISSYYPMYHPQLHPQQCNPPQPYPIYLVPIRPSQSYSIPVPHNINETATVAPIRPPLPPHTAAMITPQVAYKDATSAVDPLDNLPSNQNPSLADASYGKEFDDDLVCAQIYKSQPPAPALLPQYQTVTKAAGVVLSEASMKLDTHNIMQQVGISKP